MTTTDGFEWPQNDPLFEVSLDAIAEGLDGNGVLASGDLQVTATANANEIQVAAGDLWYAGSVYSLGAAETHVLIDGDATDDRWDSVVFDTGGGFSNVLEGNAEANPEPPSPGAGQVLLAYIYIASGETDVTDSEIKNFRAFSTDAADVRLDDAAGDYSSSHVEAALTEVVREAGDPLNGPLDLSGFSGGSVLDLGANPGPFGAIVDMVVDSNSAAGNTHSYHFAIDGTSLVKVYAESDGAGGIQNSRLDLPQGRFKLGEVGGTDAARTDYYRHDGATNYRGKQFLQPDGSFAAQLFDHDTNTILATLQLLTSGEIEIDSDLVLATGETAVDNTNKQVPRSFVDDEKATTTLTSTSLTTSDEEAVLVDTAAIGAASTVTLASADATVGNTIRVTDLTGAASSNPITVNTESGETIDGTSSYDISSPYASIVLMSDGNNWVIISAQGAGSRGPPEHDFSGAETGQVSASSQGVLVVSSVEPGEIAEVYRAVLTTDTVEAVQSGVDLELVTFDNSGGFTSQATLAAGDGATIYDDVTGSPIASYENTGTSAQSIGVIVDNTLTSAVNIVAITEGRTGL